MGMSQRFKTERWAMKLNDGVCVGVVWGEGGDVLGNKGKFEVR